MSTRIVLLLAMLLSSPSRSLAQDAPDPTTCEPDEIDMGDYCMKHSEAPREDEPGKRKVTRFPAQSMMPGRVSPSTPTPKAKTRAPATIPAVVMRDVPPAPVMAEGGFGVQFGAFSTRANAVRAAAPIRTLDLGVILSRVDRNGRTLWLTLAGPFASPEQARTALAQMRPALPSPDAWVRPLKGMNLQGLTHAPDPE
jgi:cell division septation protein DedD